MVPDADCLRRLNEQLRAWAARYPNIALLDLAALVRNVIDGKPVRACNRDWCETDLGPLLQRDRLHPTLNGTLAVVPSVPVAGMALILGIDRFMSECRALTNFIGNAVATIVVARWDKALDRDALDAALSGRPLPVAAPPVEADED